MTKVSTLRAVDGAVAHRAKALTCTGDRLSQPRRDGRARASVLLGAAIEAAQSSHEAAGRALDVHRSAVQHWADPEHPAALTLGDALVLPRSVARALLTAALRELDERPAAAVSTETLALRLGAEAGDVLRAALAAVADGHLDANERKALRRELGDVLTAVAEMMGAVG